MSGCATDQGTLESLADRKEVMKADEEKEEVLCKDNREEDRLKKPRRKDTPVLNSPPHIPGVKLLKAEKKLVHLEDEEKEEKN
ncbi:Protein phosphatase 1 regulatory subunit 17 G substrate [Channa argus]|uniref:Protein phosphatase 1 regulatory subunit 17 G substrate n=1 Tax=Channa argus TaxID=215402 RepID=A0A6G1QLJ1_CHAAH|nr:Protein phosphatase 1 regulatory subunit 17 G substrate [Channa argus]